MRTYLAIAARDVDGGQHEVTAAELVDEHGTVTTFDDDFMLGISLHTTDTPRGKYSLRIEVGRRPQLCLNVELREKKGVLGLVFANPTPRCVSLVDNCARKDDQTSPTLLTLTLTLGKRHEEVVLVAGWEYHGDDPMIGFATSYRDDQYDGKTCDIYSKTRNEKVEIPQRIHDYTIVTLFDFYSGDRVRWVKGQKGWHEMDRVLQGTVRTYREQWDADDNYYKRHDDDSISITHVYDHIIELGRIAPRSVVAFQIFSHAWGGGVIPVNTWEDDEYSARGAKQHLRDPGDKDGRPKDFSFDSMPELDYFRRAFARGAHVKVWGCLHEKAYVDMIMAERRAEAEGLSDEEEFECSIDGEKLQSTRGELRDQIGQIIVDSYMKNMAKAIGRTVYGAPPGLGSSMGKFNKRRYMYVNQGWNPKVFAWLKKHFHGIVPDGTGYLPYG